MVRLIIHVLVSALELVGVDHWGGAFCQMSFIEMCGYVV